MKRIIIFLNFLLYFCNSVSVPKSIDEKDLNTMKSFFEGRGLKNEETSTLIDILREIKSTIEAKSNATFSKQLDERFFEMNAMHDKAIQDLNEQFDILSINTRQKVDIMIENISTLRLLLVEQSEQIKMVIERIENIEDDNRITDKENTPLIPPPQRPLANLIQYSDSIPLNSLLISDILSVSPKSPQIRPFISEILQKKSDKLMKNEEKDTVESLTEKVNQLRSAVSLLNVNSGAHNVQISELQKSTENVTNRRESQNTVCSCPNETYEKILQSINAEFAKVKESNDGIRNHQTEMETLKLQIQDLEKRFSTLSGNFGDIVKELNQWKLSRDDVSSSSSDISLVKDQMEEVTKTLSGVMKMVEAGQTTSLNQSVVLCVHPYKKKSGSCYHVIDSRRLSWKDARNACKEIQGDLAAPRNFTAFRNYLLDLKLSRSYTFWVGGSDEAKEDEWKWVDGRDIIMNEEVWESSQPNQGKSNNCMEIRPNVRYVASDQRCEIRKFFICQQIGS